MLHMCFEHSLPCSHFPIKFFLFVLPNVNSGLFSAAIAVIVSLDGWARTVSRTVTTVCPVRVRTAVPASTSLTVSPVNVVKVSEVSVQICVQLRLKDDRKWKL